MICPGGAEPALQTVVVDERLLHRVQPSPSASPSIVVTSWPLMVAARVRQDSTGPPVDVDGARAALAAVAALLGALEVQPLAQRVQQRDPRLDVESSVLPLTSSVMCTGLSLPVAPLWWWLVELVEMEPDENPIHAATVADTYPISNTPA